MAISPRVCLPLYSHSVTGLQLDSTIRRGRMAPLAGKIAVVTGASRGIGKGIALVLSEQGATVYVTGRTVNPGEYYLPGTVGETAAQCTERGEKSGSGGRGIAVACDHGNDEQVAALFDQVRREQGKLD